MLIPTGGYSFGADQGCSIQVGKYASSELGRKALEGVDCAASVCECRKAGMCEERTHLLLSNTIGANNRRGTRHVNTALIVFDVIIPHGGWDETIEKSGRVLLFAAQLILAVLVSSGGSLSGSCPWCCLAWVGRRGREESLVTVCRRGRSGGPTSHAA